LLWCPPPPKVSVRPRRLPSGLQAPSLGVTRDFGGLWSMTQVPPRQRAGTTE